MQGAAGKVTAAGAAVPPSGERPLRWELLQGVPSAASGLKPIRLLVAWNLAERKD